MLLLSLAKIRTPHERFDHEYAPEVFAGDDDRETFVVTAPVTLRFDLFRDPGDQERVRLSGRIRTMVEMPCSRCLEPFSWPIDASFDLSYYPRATEATETEHQIGEDDVSTAFYDDETIDLGELMREQFYLSVPMKPLCSDRCRGLCAQCGTNLNREACDCARAWEDPRFAALKALRSRTRSH